ncbi:keratin, type I cytoskeletal 9 [Lates calcarifer]|uniref:Keratin, type I cytoskeletal 9 n=1 Tax=Lates calcarifer TaxID=8187 RepID=A0AAJ8AY71_LATCA|nr:keratin, type I cytoskeletal 9 [Lates calcarifer]
MDDVFDFEGSCMDYRQSTISSHLKKELIKSLTSFMQLYNQRKDRLKRPSDSLMLAAAQVQKEASSNEMRRSLFRFSGGVLGAVFGGVVGGAGGALGAVGAATYSTLCGEINAVGATVGFLSSILGGVAGGVFSGCVGGGVSAAAGASGSSFHGVVSNVVWFIIGFTTGGAIGGTFGGRVGAAGGAIGGGFGALHGTRIAVYLVGGASVSFRGGERKKEERMTKRVNMIQQTGDNFSETIKPLVEELKTIKAISDEITSRADVQSVSEQTAKTLAAVTAMEKTISDSQRATDLPEFASSIEEAARQSREITEELMKTNTEVKKLLVSLRKH